jgi:hypothetical protein
MLMDEKEKSRTARQAATLKQLIQPSFATKLALIGRISVPAASLGW